MVDNKMQGAPQQMLLYFALLHSPPEIIMCMPELQIDLKYMIMQIVCLLFCSCILIGTCCLHRAHIIVAHTYTLTSTHVQRYNIIIFIPFHILSSFGCCCRFQA
jgi:hypothetical protein